MELPSTNMNIHFSTDFCISMVNQVLVDKLGEGSNYVASPLSLHLMLSLVAAGTNGTTLENLLSCLGSTSVGQLNDLSSQIISLTRQQEVSEVQESKRPKLEQEQMDRKVIHLTGPTLCFVSGLWIDQRFELKPSFQEIAIGVYKAEAKRVDFENQAAKVELEVNCWVDEATRGQIKEILPPRSIKKDTGLILANAMYFKGVWNQRFDPSKTKDMDFYLLDGQVVQVPFMTGRRREKYYYKHFDGYKVLKLPYQSGSESETRQFSMYFFLPDVVNGLSNVMESLNSQPGFFSQEFVLGRAEISDFWIPRFKFSFELKASKTIKEMGLEMLFRPGELTEMIDSPADDKFCLSNVFHKCNIEVNEEGTEAAASSAAIIRRCCSIRGAPRYSFVADHPFVFMIREEHTRTVFFIGSVLNPLLGST